jgi:hypothetical protein
LKKGLIKLVVEAIDCYPFSCLKKQAYLTGGAAIAPGFMVTYLLV